MNNSAYDELKKRMKKYMLLEETSSFLEWDNKTYMPEKAITQRSEQLSLLSGMSHEILVAPETGKYLKESSAHPNLTDVQKRDIELWQREYDQRVRIPGELIEKFTKQTSKTEHYWENAKKKSDFSLIKDDLQILFDLTRTMAEKLDPDKHPYNNLLNLFEPNMTQNMVSEYFNPLKAGCMKVMNWVQSIPNRPTNQILKIKTTNAQQSQISQFLMDFLKLPKDRSRIDLSVHPFTIGRYDDVRITTHYLENDPIGSIYSVIHEGGHARYELDLPNEHRYTAIGRAIGLGMHESQSRFVENMVGRNPIFLQYLFPKMQSIIPELNKISLDEFTKAVNYVNPSKIRIYADEVTYSMHVILRFEIEKMLFNDKVTITELPQVWNQKFEEMFGISVENDREGVLQDTHWYGGLFGYFPDYALGNIYDGQFLWKMKQEIPDWEEGLKVGDGSKILNWLDVNIHKMGSLYDPADLVEKVTGKKPEAHYFIDYLTDRYKTIFG
ncbi:MAG: carboxypeptidase M32 [Promethearchaeota archaeon]